MTSTIVTNLLAPLFNTLIKDEAGVLQPVAETYLSSIISNPAPDNVVAQSMAFVPTITAALPNIEAAAARDTATALKSFLDAQLPALIASAQAKVTAQAT